KAGSDDRGARPVRAAATLGDTAGGPPRSTRCAGARGRWGAAAAGAFRDPGQQPALARSAGSTAEPAAGRPGQRAAGAPADAAIPGPATRRYGVRAPAGVGAGRRHTPARALRAAAG